MTPAQKFTEIDISDIAMWLAIIIFLILLAWRVLGSSPTPEQISLGLAMIGLWFAFKADSRLVKLEQNSLKQTELLEKLCQEVEK